jgi:hypothetical protein
VSANEDYGVLARVDPTGHVYLNLVKNTGTGTTVNISAAVTIGVTSANQPIHLRVEAVGAAPTTVRARGWLAAASEPSSWAVTASDNSAGLQTAGAPAIMSYLSGSTTNGPITTAITGLTAESPLP